MKIVQRPEKSFARHLGRHLRELSLASLPAEEATEDEELKAGRYGKRGVEDEDDALGVEMGLGGDGGDDGLDSDVSSDSGGSSAG